MGETLLDCADQGERTKMSGKTNVFFLLRSWIAVDLTCSLTLSSRFSINLIFIKFNCVSKCYCEIVFVLKISDFSKEKNLGK